MAYVPAQLSLVTTMNGQSYFSYKTTDSHAAVAIIGYFTGEALNFMRVGDVIDVFVFTTTAFTSLTSYGRHVVVSNNGTLVDVTDVTPGVMTNSS